MALCVIRTRSADFLVFLEQNKNGLHPVMDLQGPAVFFSSTGQPLENLAS